MVKPIELPPEFFAEDTELEISQESEVDDSDTVDADEDTSLDEEELEDALDTEEDSEDDEDDTEDEETGDETDEEEVDEEEEEVDEESEEEDSDEDETDKDEDQILPPFDRKKLLKEHPELEAPYKHMQAAFTRKMQEASQIRAESEAMAEQLSDFVESLSTDDGAAEFLERVALARPEVFQQVVEKWDESLADDDTREQRVREFTLRDREKKLEQKEKLEQKTAQAERINQVVTLAESTSEAEGLTDEDSIAIAKQFVLAKIHENKANTGTAQISDEEIVTAVKSAAKHVKAQRARVEKSVTQKARVDGKESAQKKLKQSQKPQPAKSKSKRTVAKKPKVPAGMDPVHYAIQKGLGVLD